MKLSRQDTKRLALQAEVLKAVAHPTRLAIAWLLRDGEQCVCDIAEAVGAERSNVSRHLAVLAQAGIVEGRKEGVTVYYSLKTPCILDVLDCATGVLRRNLEEEARILKGR